MKHMTKREEENYEFWEDGFNTAKKKYYQKGWRAGDIHGYMRKECAELEKKTLPKSGSYTQMEAEEMSKLLAKVYSISHCLYCRSCRRKLK